MPSVGETCVELISSTRVGVTLGTLVGVAVGVAVGEAVRVGGGVRVAVGVGVVVGPSNPPGAQADNPRHIIKNTKIAEVRCCLYIVSPSL